MSKESEKSAGALAIGIEEKISLGENIIYGLQHMFVVVLGPIIAAMIFGGVFGWPHELLSYVIMIFLLGAGIETTLNAYVVKLPVVQAQAILYISAMIPAVFAYGMAATWTAVLISCLIFGLLAIPVRKYGVIGRASPYIMKPLIVGVLYILIGVALIKPCAVDLIFPTVKGSIIVSAPNVIMAAIAFFIPLILGLIFRKGIIRFGNVLWGVIGGIIAGAIMGKIPWCNLAAAPWFHVPKLFPFGFEFTLSLLPLLGIMLVAAFANVLDCLGVYTGTAELGGQKMGSSRINKGIFTEQMTSFVTTIFGIISCTSYGQNLGVVSLSRVGAKTIAITAGITMIILGVFYKFAVFISILPFAIFGGSMVIVIGSLVMVGIKFIGEMEMTQTNILIAGSSIAAAVGVNFLPEAALNAIPLGLKVLLKAIPIFGMLVAIILYAIFNIGLKTPAG